MASDRDNPGIFGVIFSALLSITLGCILAVVHLVALPVEVMKAAPKEVPAAGTYYVMGAAPSAGKSWEVKRDLLAAARGSVTLTEPELNAWSQATFEPAKPEAGKSDSVMIAAGRPNFRVDGDALRIGLVNTVHFFGAETPLVLQARGKFERSGSGLEFKPNEAYFGGLPLHKIPGSASLIGSRFSGSNPPAEVEKLLQGAKAISMRDGAVVVEWP